MIKVSYHKIFANIILVVLLFISIMDGLTGIGFIDSFLTHVDELMVLAFTAYVMINIRVCFREKADITLIWIMFMCTGAVSTIAFKYQGIIPSLMDALVIINRFMMGYLSVIIYIRKNNLPISDYIDRVARIITAVLFVISVHDILLNPWFELSEFKYFTYSLKLMFGHPTYLAAAMATLLILLGYRNEDNRNILYMIMASFVGVMSLRGKAIGFFFIYWLMYILIVMIRCRNYLIIIGAGALSAAILASDQIYWYFLMEDGYSPRLILLKDGFRLMLKNIPLGTGFATFGTTIAKDYYSPVYESLGYLDNYGMNKEFSGFLSDTFWATIFAQFGIIGTVLFILVVVYFIRRSVQKLKKDKLAGFAMLMTIVYILISSLAETAFFNPVALLFFMLFAVYEKEDRTLKKRKIRVVTE